MTRSSNPSVEECSVVRVASHVHSTWSYDGKWELADLATEFGRRGYRAVLVTEHDLGFDRDRWAAHRAACAEASSADVLLVPGIEYSDAENDIHLLVWGEIPFLGEGRPTLEILKAVKQAKGVVVMAHPSRRDAWRRFDPEWKDYLTGVEIWNRKADGWAPSRQALELLEGWSPLPFVGMDFHTMKQMYPLSMELALDTPVSEEAVLDAIRTRRCHPRAWGVDLNRPAKIKAFLALQAPERCRRILARIVKPALAARR